MNTCKSCGAPITWAKTRAGKPMPLDAVPRKGVVLVDRIAHVMDVYTPHWATCPDAATHRKRPAPVAETTDKAWDEP